jgi:tRNA threonylcarbamoyladenosine biosynthesis protein TsaE
VYKLTNGRELHHYDLYRLGQSGVVGHELLEDISDPQNITVIEWAGIVENDLPADRLLIELEVTGDTDRDLKVTSHGPVSDRLAKGLKS